MVQHAKTERVSKLTDLLREAKSIILNDFTGLKVSDISELRRACRNNDVTFTVVKNTLAKKSFRELGIDGLDPLLDGPTAIAISNVDEVAPAQVLKKFVDDYERPRLKGGYVSGRVIDDREVVRLAMLPGRDVMLAQVVGTFQAPIRGFVGVLGASLRDLAGVLNAIAKKKETA